MQPILPLAHFSKAVKWMVKQVAPLPATDKMEKGAAFFLPYSFLRDMLLDYRHKGQKHPFGKGFKHLLQNHK